jgi:hypothetical protein
MQRVGLRMPGEFCNLDTASAAPRLVVSVKNQGTAPAPDSVTRVEFDRGGTYELATPRIPAGGAADLPPLVIPPACFAPNCQFRITVDSTQVAGDRATRNNTATGRCAS